MLSCMWRPTTASRPSTSSRPRPACRPQAVSRLTAKLDCIQTTGVLALDLTWLNNNLQKALARHAAQASVQRLRLLDAPQRYTVLVCFLMQTYHETLDQLVEMYDKLITATYRRAQALG